MVHLPTYGGFSYFEQPNEAELQRYNEARLFRLCNKIVAPSHFAADLISRTHNVVPRDIFVVHPGVESRIATENRRDSPNRPLQVVWHGRFALQKGLHELVEVIGALRPESCDVFVAGRSLENRHLNLLSTISAKFLGQLSVNEIDQLLVRADVILSTSLHETFGFSVLEGMAAGAVPVAFDVGSLSELITNRVSGVLVSPIEPISMARQLEQLNEDRESLRRMSAVAKLVASEFTWDRHVDLLKRVIE